MRLRSFIIALAGCALPIEIAFGSAFALNELGARAQGMGGAFTSIADDASAIFFNPAGIAFQKGMQMQMDSLVVVGLFRYFPSATPPGTVVPANGYSGSVKPHFIPVASLYLTKSLGERWAFGFGMYTPFGLSANFTNFNDGDPANTKFVGRYAGTRGRLESFWFQPTIAYRMSKSQAISIGVALVHTHLFLEQSILNPLDTPDNFGRDLAKDVFPGVDPNVAYKSFARLLPEGRFRAATTSNAPGFSAGYIFKHERSKMNFGVMWRSPVVHHLKGKASFGFTNEGAITPFLPKDRTLQILFPNQDIKGTFVTPATYVAGVSTSRFWNSVIAFDFRVQDFARFVDVPLNFSITADAKGKEIATSSENRLDFNFRNSYLIHAGIEKHLNEKTDVRVGYTFDYSPVIDKSVGPLFPDANRHSFTVGASRRRNNVEFTLFYQAMQMVNRTTNVAENNFQWTNGDYRNFAHLAGAGLRLHLGKKAQ